MQSGCGWWLPYRNLLVLSDRPREIHRDARGRLHRENGMALSYRDGWGLWALNGVAVTEQIVMRPETLTAAEIDAERNADVRAVMVERYGYRRYLHEKGARSLDVQVDRFGRPMALMATADERDPHILVCTDGSTTRVHHCPVPRAVRDCMAAESWLMGGIDFQRVKAAS
jgi:hypothetical protein